MQVFKLLRRVEGYNSYRRFGETFTFKFRQSEKSNCHRSKKFPISNNTIAKSPFISVPQYVVASKRTFRFYSSKVMALTHPNVWGSHTDCCHRCPQLAVPYRLVSRWSHLFFLSEEESRESRVMMIFMICTHHTSLGSANDDLYDLHSPHIIRVSKWWSLWFALTTHH